MISSNQNQSQKPMDRIQATNELAFRVGFSGYSGHLRVEPLSTVERTNPVKSLPDFILPPAFPRENHESLKEHLEEEYLLPRLDSDEFQQKKLEGSGILIEDKSRDLNKEGGNQIQYRYGVLSKCVYSSAEEFLSTQHEFGNGKVDMSELTVGAPDSSPLPRVAGPAKDFVRGSINKRPFRPGGLDDSQSLERILPSGATNGEWVHELLNGGPAQSTAPSLKQGLDLGELKAYPCSWNVYKDQSPFNTTSREKLNELSVQFDDLFKKAWEEDIITEYEGDGHLSKEDSPKSDDEVGKIDVFESVSETALSVLDEILSAESGGLASKSDGSVDAGGRQQKEAWALSGSSEWIAEHFYELVPDMALNFPFELDTFQKEAIYYLEKGDSVFVAAHTSAGKTVVAEYAFALASKHCTRAVYTAPIKTISNQKYRDFCGKFDVGLLTGDISLRPESSCLIMTTEILRSMLYRGADIMRVIFDEVHYVNDAERGVVWEEVIIMLPRHVNIVLLSATNCKRPVPLEHCLFFSGELYKICENETFIPQGLKAAKDALKKNSTNTVGRGSLAMRDGGYGQKREYSNRSKQNKHSGSQNFGSFSGISGGNQNNGSGQNNWGSRRSEASLWLQLVNKLSKKSLLPVVIFCFSKNRCDKSADCMSGTDLTSSSEKSGIRVFCDKAFSRLKGSDRNLPQVLFSTETFAMGVNAPARTVVFDTLTKFDGKEFRQLLPGEYTQMAGRAGRRGLDKIGTVVVMCRDEIPEENDLNHVIAGSATRLESQFRLTYIMILHLLRVEELKKIVAQGVLQPKCYVEFLAAKELVEDMLKRSFAEFHTQKTLPETQQILMRKLAQPTKAIECIKGEPAIEEYYDMYLEAEEYGNQISEAVMQSSDAQRLLFPGRVVVVKSQSAQDHLLGVVVKGPSTNMKQYIVLVLKPDLPSSMQISNVQDKRSGDGPQAYLLMPKSKRGVEDYFYPSTSRKGSGAINIKLPHQGSAAGVGYEVRAMDSKEFLCICKSKIKINPAGLLEDISNTAFSKTVQELLELKSEGKKYPPALDPRKHLLYTCLARPFGFSPLPIRLGKLNSLISPIGNLTVQMVLNHGCYSVSDLKMKDMNLVEAYNKWTRLLQKMSMNKCHGCIKLEEHITLAREIKKHKDEIDKLKYQMSDEALQQMPDFQGRIDVLKEIGCIDADLVVQIKGRVACEMNSGEELICTECLFENQLDDLEPEEAVAIMSAFVFQQRNTSEPSLTPKLSEAKKRELGSVKGTPFADICELTDVPEGLIVRTIVRLDETCREFKNAAAIMSFGTQKISFLQKYLSKQLYPFGKKKKKQQSHQSDLEIEGNDLGLFYSFPFDRDPAVVKPSRFNLRSDHIPSRGEVKPKKKGEMANKISNFSDLIQRVAASCLLHPLAAGRQDPGNVAEDGREGYEYETDEQEDFEDEDEEYVEEEEDMEEKKGSVKGWDHEKKNMSGIVAIERVMEMEMLMNEVFDSVSAMKRAYVSLQEAHCPWDPERMRVADVAVVGELRRLGVLRERFRRCVSVGGRGGRKRIDGDGMGMLKEVVAPYEAAVEELKKEVKSRDVEVENLKEKLKNLSTSLSNGNGKKGRSQSKRKVGCIHAAQVAAAPAPDLFEATMNQVKETSKSFTSLLLSLMRAAHWDIAAAVRSIEAATATAENVATINHTTAIASTIVTHHAKYALESYISRKIFQGFDHETFYMDGSLSSLLNPDQFRRDCFTQYRDMKAMDPIELLGICQLVTLGNSASESMLP
ncbi:hypothetical protein GH714_035213 [Hevea brasiliensis]|uniref:Helicase ATP-binding domain-containing protein n=1 Tax=Hevea brasiliensis TaxID=3981 RepID=A0A6A6MJR8_HEVBR|nr:hypothetical protein GH714_035213 [Hevea brasiliensis]